VNDQPQISGVTCQKSSGAQHLVLVDSTSRANEERRKPLLDTLRDDPIQMAAHLTSVVLSKSENNDTNAITHAFKFMPVITTELVGMVHEHSTFGY